MRAYWRTGPQLYEKPRAFPMAWTLEACGPAARGFFEMADWPKTVSPVAAFLTGEWRELADSGPPVFSRHPDSERTSLSVMPH